MRNRPPMERSAMIKAQDGHLTVTMSDGPTLVTHSSGASCLCKVAEFLARTDPDVIFMDIHLPLSIGKDLLRMIGETSSGKRVVLGPVENIRLQAIA